VLGTRECFGNGTLSAECTCALLPPQPPSPPRSPPPLALGQNQLLDLQRMGELGCDPDTHTLTPDRSACTCGADFFRPAGLGPEQACLPCSQPAGGGGEEEYVAYGGTCSECLPHSECQVADGSVGVHLTDLRPASGYWRTAPTSRQFYSCGSLLDALGSEVALCGSEYANASTATPGCEVTGCCYEGHTGPACKACADGFGQRLDRCVRCPARRDYKQRALDWLQMAAVAALGLAGVGLFVVLRTSPRRDAAQVREGDRPNVLTVAKIFHNFLVVGGIVSQLRVKYSALVQAVLDVEDKASSFGGFELSGFDCEMGLGFYERHVLYAVLPVAGVAYSACVTLGAQRYRLRRGGRAEGAGSVPWHAPLEGAAWVVLNLMYTTSVRFELLAFVCDEYGEASGGRRVSLLRHDPTVSCLTERHAAARDLAAFVLAVYGLGFPLLVVLRMVVHRGALDDAATRMRLGFFLAGYHGGAWWWEGTVLARKLLLVVVSVFYSNDAFNQLVLTTLVLLVALVAQSRYQPFKSPYVNKLELGALWVNCTTLMGGMIFHNPDNAGTDLAKATTAVLLGINALTIAAFTGVLAVLALPKVYTAARGAASRLHRAVTHPGAAAQAAAEHGTGSVEEGGGEPAAGAEAAQEEGSPSAVELGCIHPGEGAMEEAVVLPNSQSVVVMTSNPLAADVPGAE